ncbi:MAG: DUF5618 family protein [Candidatus Brocadia sp.]
MIAVFAGAKDILARIPVEGNNYTDVKPVRETSGTVYLTVLEAINEALLKKIGKKGLSKSVDGYRKAFAAIFCRS